ncbi:MAG: sigma-54 dependent transcriptional regulator [Candidatus Krumholzibacteriia bacterium]
MFVHALVVTNDARRSGRLVRSLDRLDEVRTSSDVPQRLWDRLNTGDVDLVLIDRSSLSNTPAAVVAAIRQLPEQPEVIALTEREDGELRAGLLAAGCLAVLHPGLEDLRLGEVLAALVQRRRHEQVRQLGGERWPDKASLRDFVSESPTMQRFVAMARRVVNSDSSLLLLGETGVGKERLASAIHHDGPRRSGPFLGVNCAALPEALLESELFGHELGAFTGATRTRRGYFEQAHGGTIFLDEIAEMPLHLQVKLLRVLESRTVMRVGGEVTQRIDVRLMAATNRDLEAAVAAGRFRADLYFRLAVVTLRLPPLRERREDIPGLLASYLEHFRASLGGPVRTVSPDALDALVGYAWPGNVRELINVVERTTLLASAPVIDRDDLPAEIVGRPAPASAGTDLSGLVASAGPWRHLGLAQARDRVLDAFHREYLAALLADHGGRIGASAHAAGISPRTLYALMKRHGLRKEDFRASRPPLGRRAEG